LIGCFTDPHPKDDIKEKMKIGVDGYKVRINFTYSVYAWNQDGKLSAALSKEFDDVMKPIWGAKPDKLQPKEMMLKFQKKYEERKKKQNENKECVKWAFWDVFVEEDKTEGPPK
jgi:hypothetical protein